MYLFAGIAEVSTRALGLEVCEQLRRAQPTPPRRFSAMIFDEDDFRLARAETTRLGTTRLLRALERTPTPEAEAGLLALLVCGFLRYRWTGAGSAGADAVWPLACDRLGLPREESEPLARAFLESARRLELVRAWEGHHRVHTAFRNAGFPAGLLRRWFATLKRGGPEATSSKLDDAMAGLEEEALKRASRDLLEAAHAGRPRDELRQRAEQLVALGLGEDPSRVLDAAEAVSAGEEELALDPGWRYGLQIVPAVPRHRLVLFRALDAFEGPASCTLRGASGLPCAVPPTAGRRYLAVPQPWGVDGSVALEDAGASRELASLPWPGEVLLFAGTDHADLLKLVDGIPPDGAAVVMPASYALAPETPIAPEPLRQDAPACRVFHLSAERAPYTVRDGNGHDVAVIDRAGAALAIHPRAAAPHARAMDGGTVCFELPELSLRAPCTRVRVEPAGPCSLAAALEREIAVAAGGERRALAELMPEAAPVVGKLRVRLSAGAEEVCRPLWRLPRVVTSRPEHGVARPGVWLRPHPLLRAVEGGPPASRFWPVRVSGRTASITLSYAIADAPVDVELRWPHRPLAVELVFRSFVDRREPAAPRVLLSDLLAAAARGEDDQGIALSAPPRTRFRVRLLDGALPWHRLGRRGAAFLSAGWLEAALRSVIPDFQERLRARRFAAPLEVELELDEGRRSFVPVALFGQDAPAEARVEVGERLSVRLRSVPEPWLAGAPEGEPAAWFLIGDHDAPYRRAEKLHGELRLEGDTVLIAAAAPELGRYSVRTRARGWPQRFGVHVANGARLEPTEAFTSQLERILSLAGARVTAATLARCFKDAPHGTGVWRALDLALDALRGLRFPPPEAADWLEAEVGEEPYLASPLPALLARAAPELVVRIALQAVACRRVAADAAATWLKELRLVPWLIPRESIGSWPAELAATLRSVVDELMAAPARDTVSDGWFRLLLLHAFARGGDAATAIVECLPLLQATGLPIARLLEVSPSWPSVTEALRLKELTRMPAADRPYAQIWYRCQLAGRGDRELPAPRFPRQPIAENAPPHLRREPFTRASALASDTWALARATARGTARPTAADHAALEDALGLGAAWFATCLLQHELRESR